jgi:hypothetical protein
MSDFVKLQLVESFALPMLTYAIDAVNLTNLQTCELNTCWNNVYRKIFVMNRWESVKCIQFFCGRLDFIRILHSRILKFAINLQKSINVILKETCHYYMNSSYLHNVVVLYDIDLISCNNHYARRKILSVFQNDCLKI